MKRFVFICVLIFSAWLTRAQNIFVCNQAAISFFSSAPVEDIKANTNKGFFAYNTKTKEVYFKVPVNTFQFRKSLMQRHFNDTYLETDKYPYAEFKGNIVQDIDPASKGAHQVDVQGNLTLHGVTRPYRVSGTLTFDDRGVTATAAFVVELVNHHIEIPTLLFKNIAESVEVKVNATAVPK